EFGQKLEGFKALIAELEKIRADWKIAMPEEQKKLEQDFNAKLAEGDKLLPGLTTAAEKAFAAGGDDKQLAGEFLAAVANTSGEQNDYESTARLTKLLLDNGFEAKGL